MGSTPHSSSGIGPLLHQLQERLIKMRLTQQEISVEARHAASRVDRLEKEQAELRAAVRAVWGDAAKGREAAKAVAEIERRLNQAILWLALGAGGLLLKFIGPKLGL